MAARADPAGSRPRVLVTGANGFIGSAFVADLISEGYEVLAAVRDPARMQRRFPSVRAVAVDLNTMTAPADWQTLVRGLDAVVNVAGILQSAPGQSAEAIHTHAPKALFRATADAGVRRIVQVSAVSVDAASEYARTKAAADAFLMGLECDWVVLRPSLVYGRRAYGGTALMRALAVVPFAVPLVGAGDQAFQPIHVRDLCKTLIWAIRSDDAAGALVQPCGPERLDMRDILALYRAWLGRPEARFVSVPRPLVAGLCRLGDFFGSGPLRTTSLVQIEHGNLADPAEFEARTGIVARPMAEMLEREPSATGELWQARGFLVRPLVRASLVLLWLVSGLLGLMAPTGESAVWFSALGVPNALHGVLAKAAGAADLAIAFLLATGLRPTFTAWAQLALISGYTLALTIAAPDLWGDLFGPLLKNIPIAALVVVDRILSEER